MSVTCTYSRRREFAERVAGMTYSMRMFFHEGDFDGGIQAEERREYYLHAYRLLFGESPEVEEPGNGKIVVSFPERGERFHFGFDRKSWAIG